MRRIVLVVMTTLIMACAGIWVGAIIAMGAIAAPQVFREVTEPAPGIVMGHIFSRLNMVSLAVLCAILFLSLVDAGYRRRASDRIWEFLRVVFVGGGLLLTLYLQFWMMPKLERLQNESDMTTFDALHTEYEGLAQISVLLGVATIGATSALQIGWRRKPRAVVEAPVGPAVP